MAAQRYWLVKTEPGTYSFAQLQKDKHTAWTGVRNFEARNNLRAMKRGELVLVYHSGKDKQIVGVAKVASQPGPDPTAPGEDWASVELVPEEALARPVTLAHLRAEKALAGMALLSKPRLSVAPVTLAEYERVRRMGAPSRR